MKLGLPGTKLILHNKSLNWADFRTYKPHIRISNTQKLQNKRTPTLYQHRSPLVAEQEGFEPSDGF